MRTHATGIGDALRRDLVAELDEGLERTVQWYRDNEEWWAPIRSGDYLEYYKRQYGQSRSA